jgi:hypothetical protein
MNIEDAVTKLIKKSMECEKSEDALRFTQSVSNLTHAKLAAGNIGKDKKPPVIR